MIHYGGQDKNAVTGRTGAGKSTTIWKPQRRYRLTCGHILPLLAVVPAGRGGDGVVVRRLNQSTHAHRTKTRVRSHDKRFLVRPVCLSLLELDFMFYIGFSIENWMKGLSRSRCFVHDDGRQKPTKGRSMASQSI